MVLQLSDVRILAFGTSSKSASNYKLNPNAHMFLNPPGIISRNQDNNAFSRFASAQRPYSFIGGHEVYQPLTTAISDFRETPSLNLSCRF
jgi:hypothetical protein